MGADLTLIFLSILIHLQLNSACVSEIPVAYVSENMGSVEQNDLYKMAYAKFKHELF